MVKLKNKHLAVKINPIGAELKSIIYRDTERLWQGEEASWQRTAPTLFPFCGGLKEGKFTLGEEEYACDKHGFAKDMEFTVEEHTKHRAVLLLVSNEETLKKYPFEFELRVTFTLNKKSILIKYSVKNTGDKKLYFSAGSHESYFCEGGIENFDILFPRKETLSTCIIDGGLIGTEKAPVIRLSKQMPLLEKYLENDSLVFEDMLSRKLILRNRTNGERIKIEFPGFNYFVIWSIPGKEYICLEPWAGMPDSTEHNGKIENKKGIIKVAKNKTKHLLHKISFLPEL